MDFKQDDFVEYDMGTLKGIGKICGSDGDGEFVVELQKSYQVPYHGYKFTHKIFHEDNLKLKIFYYKQELRKTNDFKYALKLYLKQGISLEYAEQIAFGYSQGKEDRSPDEGFSEERHATKTIGYSYHYSLGYSLAYEERPYLER